jgi:hypothetical protein
MTTKGQFLGGSLWLGECYNTSTTCDKLGDTEMTE